jgi:hypothetical protein
MASCACILALPAIAAREVSNYIVYQHHHKTGQKERNHELLKLLILCFRVVSHRQFEIVVKRAV